MLMDIIMQAQQSNKEAMLELIEKFDPLLRKYSVKLNYEDAYEDLLLYFIEFIKTFNICKLRCSQDGVIISYINISIKNFYNKKIAEIVLRRKEIALSNLSEEQAYCINAKMAKYDEYGFMFEFDIKEVLTEEEYDVIYKIYVRGYSAAEIANMTDKSRQAVNQMKQRALAKLEKCIK